jgi:hypothetical protein
VAAAGRISSSVLSVKSFTSTSGACNSNNSRNSGKSLNTKSLLLKQQPLAMWALCLKSAEHQEPKKTTTIIVFECPSAHLAERICSGCACPL